MNPENIESSPKKEWNIPLAGKLNRIIREFSLTEKTLFFVLSVVFIASGISLLYQVNKLFLVQEPTYGGSLVEGVIGTPRFINPLLAVSEIDKDLTSLIYSGLLRVNSDGDLVPDLAESYSISPDGLNYTFILKDGLYFHDGKRITVDDVIFTIQKAQTSELKSPKESNWLGVTAEKVDDKTVRFILRQPYSPFIQNTTLGILPKHIWEKATIEEFPFSDFNVEPIGSGPYKIESVAYSSSRIPSEYNLVSFKNYSLGRPYISKVTIKAYPNEKELVDAFKKTDVESMHSISPKVLPELNLKNSQITLTTLPRVFGVFFNQNSAPVLANKEVRQALDASAPKELIIETILNGYGKPLNGPTHLDIATSSEEISGSIERAREILTKAGWKQNESGIFEKKVGTQTTRLSFSISTGSAVELKESALILQKYWQDLGAEVELKIFEIGDLNQDVIRPRKYDALLFGEVISRDFDLYPFWHSAEKSDPGLNIAMYTNVQVDKFLENIRKTSTKEEKMTNLDNAIKEIKNDKPAVFTYSPEFIYVMPNKIQNVKIGNPTGPSERFNEIFEWYIETNSVWKIFTKENQN